MTRISTIILLTIVGLATAGAYLARAQGTSPGFPQRANPWNPDAVTDPATELLQKIRTPDQSLRRLLADYSKTTDAAAREKLTVELKKLVDEQFAERQAARETELKELEAQIKRLREIHQRREQQKDRIVADRLQQLLRDADGLGWGTEDAGPVGRELRLPLNFDRARLDGDWTKKRELFEITRPGADSALPPPGDSSRDR